MMVFYKQNCYASIVARFKNGFPKYLTIIPQASVGYQMVDSQQGA